MYAGIRNFSLLSRISSFVRFLVLFIYYLPLSQLYFTARLARHKPAAAGRACIFSIFSYHLSSGNSHHRITRKLHSLVGGPVAFRCKFFIINSDLLFRVKDNDISVRAFGYGSLSGIKPEKFSGIGRNKRNEPVQREPVLPDEMTVHRREKGLYSRHAVRYLCEIPVPHILLFRIKSAGIGGEHFHAAFFHGGQKS